MTNNHNKSTYRRQKKQLLLFNTLVSIVLAVSIVFAGALGVLAYMTGNMRKGLISQDHGDLGISSEISNKLPKEIVNIALFGLDSNARETTNLTHALTGRSDTIIIVSINTIENTIKLTSILRDSWVKIDGSSKFNGYNKINAAYSYGGAELAIKTLNQTFNLNITDYIAVNFHQTALVFEALGGVDIEITEMERRRINEMSNEEGFTCELLPKTGLVHLNGIQALAYSRIRDDSDEIRVLRQQKVLSCLFEKAKQLAPSEYPSKLRKILSTVETSMSYDELISFAPLLAISDLHLESTSVPGKEVVGKGGIFSDTRGGWVWKFDYDEAKEYIYKWIYGI